MKHYSSLFAGLAMLIALTIFSIPAAATRYYVNDDGGADNKSGTGGWTTAYKTLQKALENASAGDEIWVAKGTYYPSVAADGISTDPRDKSFVLVEDVKIYGGFAGNEANIDQRDWVANKTILSGDIGTINDSTDNVYHVVISINCTDAALLDGLTISGGNADGSSLITVNTKTVNRYYGGGMYNNSSSPTLTNVTISGNSASYGGGGMSNSSSSSPMLTNVTISGNTAKNEGGGMCNYSSSPTLTNVTISGNTAKNGGGMYNTGSSSEPNMKNSIIWGNNSGVYNYSSAAPVYTYSLVQGEHLTDNGNLDGTNAANNPQFVSPLSPGLSTGGDYRLKEGSPVINKGCNSLYAEIGAGTKDLDGNLRIRGNPDSIDLGAYEFVEIVPTNGIIYVDSAVAANSNYTGSSWKNAIANLDEALAYTRTHTPGKDSIFVAKGTYYPSVIAGDGDEDRDKAFVLVKDVKIYGGFAGNEATIDQRTPGNTTILSGNNNNAYHVVISAGAVGTALLDGLTISGGNADGGGSIDVNGNFVNGLNGGGMYNVSSSPALTNVTISGNSANLCGGGMFNLSSSSPTLANVTISGNSANLGGGMYNISSSPTLINVTISGNTATISGGGMYNYGSSSEPNIKNSIIWGNNSGVDNNSAVPVYTYSLVQGEHLTDNGNLDSTINPQFVDSAGGDYRLHWSSPAIDAGDNSLNATTKDLAGNPRRFGPIDMGAYEFVETIFPAGGVIYVDSAVAGGKHDGSSWDNAVASLDEALFFTKRKTANGGAADSIFVAKGTYYPSVKAATTDNLGNPTTDRDKAFVLVKDVKIYGGFAGTEATIDQRTPGNTTILSGNNSAYHVVISADSVGTALLDGLTISGGNADGFRDITVNGKILFPCNGAGMINHSSSPMLTNVIISGNTNSFGKGAGMYNGDSSSPTLTNVTISGNTADNGDGGGMYNDASSPVLTNVTISGNTASTGGGMHNYSSSSPELTNVTISGNMADVFGGGMYNIFSSSPKLTNVTISGNMADMFGGGMYNYSSSTPTIQNSIIWGNNTGVYNNSAVPEYKYSLVQSEHLTDNGNLDSTNNPQFVDSAGGDYRLKWNSPAIDAGDNSLNATTKDLAGNPRRFGPIDMGAYENQDNYYTVIMPDGDVTGISSINITVDENDYLQFLPGEYHVHSGSNFTFTLTYAAGYDETPAVVENNGDTLSPNDAGTYTISNEAVVTITGVANDDTEEDNDDTEEDNDDGDEDGDGSDNNDNGYDGVGLVITDGTTTIIERIYIDSIEVPFDTTKAVNYTVACGQSGKLRFRLTTEASGPALVTMPPLDTTFDFTPKPGLNHIPVNIFAIDGTVSHQYDFVIEKQFEYDSLIDQKWNNTLLVRSNPSNNGGYTFVKYEWFRNNTSIGTEGFYSAGDLRTDLLDFDALYYAEMRTKDGQKLQTCPGKPVKTAVATSLRVYPNPVRRGNIAHIQSGSNTEQLLNVAEPTEVSIYDSMGKFVKVQKLTAPLTEFVLDVAPGLYFIRLGEQQVKVVVD